MSPSQLNADDKGRRLWIWMALATLVIVLLIVTTAVLYLGDGPEVDDSHMRPSWHPEDERLNNPLATFLIWLDAHPLKKDERFRLAAAKQPWNQTEAEALISLHTEHLQAVDKLLATAPATWIWPKGPAMASFTAPMGDASSIQWLGSLVVIRSKVSTSPTDAIPLAADAMRLGSGIVQAEGTTIHTLMGIVMHAQGQQALERGVRRTETGKAELTLAHEQLRLYPILSRDIAFALRVEHETLRNAIHAVAAGQPSGLPTADALPGEFGVIKPNKALQLSMDLNGPLLSCLDQGWSGLSQVSSARNQRLSRLKSAPHRAFTVGIGGILVSMASESGDIIVIQAADVEVQRVLAMTQIALRRHELEYGTLPDTLADLSPPVPDEETRDPWSGHSLIWNRKTQLLYSVGQNGRDDGGSFDLQKPRTGADRGSKYWWSEDSTSPSAAPASGAK